MSTETQSPRLAPTRILHTMLRVKDLDRSVDFYTRLLGMSELRRMEFPGGKFTLVFLGYGDEDSEAVLELTWNWEHDEPYELGTGYGHIALAAPDIYETCAELEARGCDIPRPPGPMKHGSRVIAFIKDPDGYMIELVQRD
ncbi:lactoylglutathione lyase [Microbaculum marinum]|uniref:Lactoylglutathione lyase n=1 Tax=Microbaculum marinum TaxID=1764581 RepID=A0AAW9RP03_9HYPH